MKRMNLGKVLAGYRRDAKLSLREMAQQTGIDRTTLWRLEQGREKTCKQWPSVIRWLLTE